MINVNIKHKYWYLDPAYLFGDTAAGEDPVPVVVHALQSFGGFELHFHVLTDFGAHISTVPLHVIWHTPEKPTEEVYDYHELQLWDCFGDTAGYIEYDYLIGNRCQTMLKNGKKPWGTYFGTVYWADNGFTEEPTQFKEGHIIGLDNGQLAVQPNNRIKWKDMSFVTAPWPKHRILLSKERLSVEAVSDRWVTSGDDSFYYEVKGTVDDNDKEPITQKAPTA